MRNAAVEKIVNAVLYEGYMLYPYRRSALKNQHRWNFGVVYPEGLSPTFMKTECLVQGGTGTAVDVEVKFLQLHEQNSWQEAIERTVSIAGDGVHEFSFEPLLGDVRVARERIDPGLEKIRVEITNRTRRSEATDPLLRSLVSTHTVLTARQGSFVSLLDPGESLREVAGTCQNVGTWPVLVGKEPQRDCMLSSPIILYDYPRIAEESPGDLFDGTEIDEILSLRILTLTDSEKEEMRQSGERERSLLERVEALQPEQLLKLHGTMRDVRSGLQRGDRVRLKPKPGGDILDVVLAGRVAIVEAVEQDFDNRTYVAVVIEDDPGKDLGMMRHPGHRFFFSTDEVERIA